MRAAFYVVLAILLWAFVFGAGVLLGFQWNDVEQKIECLNTFPAPSQSATQSP